MDAYLSKPLRRQELARIIDDVLPAGPVRAPTGPEHVPEARSTRAVLDREAALARLEGDEALFAELVDVYLEEWPKLFAEIRVALAAGDLPAVGHRAHRLCGLAKTFDAHVASDTAARIEAAAARGDPTTVAADCVEMEAQFTRLQDVLAGLQGPRATGRR
jgi:two-component system, sensor histidine kinase and response regulator